VLSRRLAGESGTCRQAAPGSFNLDRAPSPGSARGAPARHGRAALASYHRSIRVHQANATGRGPSSSAPHCPARRHRVALRASLRDGFANLDAAPTRKDLAPVRKTGDKQAITRCGRLRPQQASTGHWRSAQQVRDAGRTVVTVTRSSPIPLPHLKPGEDTRYEPGGRRKVATPALSVRDETFVLAEVIVTSAFAIGMSGRPYGPPVVPALTFECAYWPGGGIDKQAHDQRDYSASYTGKESSDTYPPAHRIPGCS
jgi:hypothetical protein